MAEVLKGTVLVCSTALMNVVQTGYAQSLATLMLQAGPPPVGPIIGFHMESSAPNVPGARNNTIKVFLDSPAEFLLWVDPDMQFTPETFSILYNAANTPVNPPGLSKLSLPSKAEVVPKIVSALAFVYSQSTGDMIPNIFMRDDDGIHHLQELYQKGKQFWCDATGVAFTLIHREVFEAMTPPWHEIHMAHPETGQPMGHDVSFYYEAAKLGYHVWYCADAKTGHVKTFAANEELYERHLAAKGKELL